MPDPQRFKELSHRDITDQSQASSSREASPERLQQLRRQHGFPTEDKGKGLMTPEHIQEVIKQRGEKTSGEIPLGHQPDRYPGRGGADDPGEFRRLLEQSSIEKKSFERRKKKVEEDFSQKTDDLNKKLEGETKKDKGESSDEKKSNGKRLTN